MLRRTIRPRVITTGHRQRYSYSSQSQVAKPYSFVRTLAPDRYNYEQGHLKKELARHLSTQHGSPELIASLESDGFCHGFTAFGLHALWLENQPQQHDENNQALLRLDGRWYWNLLRRISTLSQQTLTPMDNNVVNGFIGQLNCLQKIHELGPKLITQGDFEKSFPIVFNADIKREYSLVGAFKIGDFFKPINIKHKKHTTTLLHEIVKKNRMILISIGKHDTGLFLHDNYYFYNCDDSKGIFSSHPGQAYRLVEYIFNSHNLSGNHPEVLTFRMFASSNSVAEYPEQSDLLSALATPHVDKSGASALYNAAGIGCVGSVEHYLKNGANVNFVEPRLNYTPLHIAATRNYPAVVKQLLEHPDTRTDLPSSLDMLASELSLEFGNTDVNHAFEEHFRRNKSVTLFGSKPKTPTTQVELNARSLTLTKKPG